MKKLLLTMSAIALGLSGLFAQQSDIRPEHMNTTVKGTYVKEGKRLVPTSRGANDVSTWYGFTNSYKEGTLLGQDYSTYVSFIWPDTTAYIVYSDGAKSKIGFHVVGSTFDPKDTNFIATGEQVLTKFNPYTVDSLAYTQFYIRQLDSFDFGAGNVEVIDTLFIQYFDITGIDIKTYIYTGQIPQVTYYAGYPKEAGFSTQTLLNSTRIKTDTLLLDKSMADSVVFDGANTLYFGRGVQVPVGIVSKSTSTAPVTNNMTAFSMVYKPMRKTVLGDTLVAYNGSTWSKKFNMFGVRLAYLDQHDQLITTPYRINNFFVSNYQMRYGATFGPFKGYLPGPVFGSTIFFPSFLHITTSNLSDNKLSANGISGAVVYPNPASVNSSADVAFNLTSTSQVAATVTDLNGRVVATYPAKTYAAGTNVLHISTENMSKGIYMIVLEGSAGKTTAKLNIQ